jgi:hypothetical protein
MHSEWFVVSHFLQLLLETGKEARENSEKGRTRSGELK